jgi:chromate reductase
VKILGISGSLRSASHNTSLLLAAAEQLRGGVDFELWQGLKAVPPYDEDDDVEPAPPAVVGLREALAGADAVLFATPEYNASIPGQLKNALDWVSRPLATNPLRSKPVAVMGASTGAFGAVWSQAELRKVLRTIGARVLDVELPVSHAHVQLGDGGMTADVAAGLADVTDALVAAVRERELSIRPASAGRMARKARPGRRIDTATPSRFVGESRRIG